MRRVGRTEGWGGREARFVGTAAQFVLDVLVGVFARRGVPGFGGVGGSGLSAFPIFSSPVCPQPP